MARSRVSAPAFCTVMIRKNSPVTNGTTSAYSRKMTWNDWRTCATPGASSAAWSRVSASRSSLTALIDATSASGVVPATGATPSVFGKGVPASGLRAATAAR